jgi:predicted phosphohydrolase
MRLETSLKAAGEREKLVFLHYPPVYQNYRCKEILELLQDYHVTRCCYGHIHGKGIATAYRGMLGCTDFRIVSADAVCFEPVLVLDED